MKRVFTVIVIALFVFGIVLFFIPASLENRVFIANTYQNIASSLNQPRNWIKWDASVREAWPRGYYLRNYVVNNSIAVIFVL